MITSLNAIRAHSTCAGEWEKLMRHLGKTRADDEPLPLLTVLEINGLDDALWCLRAVAGHDRELRLYIVWCVRQVQHLMTDPRSLRALDVAADFANGQAGEDELEAASYAAWAATSDAAWAATSDAAWAATSDAAWAAAWAATSDAASAASAAASAASDAASDAASAAASAAASDAARAAQAAELRRICQAIESGQDPYPTV